MKIFPFRAMHPKLNLVAYPDEFFASAKLQFQDYRDNGFFQEEEEQALYVYEIVEAGVHHLGVLASVNIEDYSDGNILIHEHTLIEKEQQFIDLYLERKAMIKPIMLTHSPSDELQKVLRTVSEGREPTIEVAFDSDDTIHRFWRVTEAEQMAEISREFDKAVSRAYIADGHHRSRATERLHKMVVRKKGGLKFDRIFCGVFAFDQLKIREYNRVISVLNSISPSLIMARLSSICEIRPLKEIELPGKPGEMTMLLKNEAYSLRWKEETIENYNREPMLDAVMFNELICRDICSITDIRTDSRIKYIKGAHGIDGVKRHTDYKEDVAFFLYPLTMEEFKHCSDNEFVLPPKTTYFTPRMKNGVVVHLIHTE